MSATGILQATAVIAKTTQTLVGAVIGTENAKHITLFGTYTKGDETGLDIVVSFLRTETGTAHPLSVWSPTAGVYTRADAKYRLTATANFAIQLDIPAVDFLKVTQGGSNNDGTPTGTLAMSYTLGFDR
jgi:hypothetical protein